MSIVPVNRHQKFSEESYNTNDYNVRIWYIFNYLIVFVFLGESAVKNVLLSTILLYTENFNYKYYYYC